MSYKAIYGRTMASLGTTDPGSPELRRHACEGPTLDAAKQAFTEAVPKDGEWWCQIETMLEDPPRMVARGLAKSGTVTWESVCWEAG